MSVNVKARVCGALSALLLLAATTGCGGGSTQSGNTTAAGSSAGATANAITAADVRAIVTQAAQSVNVPLVIAVTDRSGNILGVYRKAGAPATAMANFSQV